MLSNKSNLMFSHFHILISSSSSSYFSTLKSLPFHPHSGFELVIFNKLMLRTGEWLAQQFISSAVYDQRDPKKGIKRKTASSLWRLSQWSVTTRLTDDLCLWKEKPPSRNIRRKSRDVRFLLPSMEESFFRYREEIQRKREKKRGKQEKWRAGREKHEHRLKGGVASLFPVLLVCYCFPPSFWLTRSFLFSRHHHHQNTGSWVSKYIFSTIIHGLNRCPWL